MNARHDDGFTLIELMITIALIAILLALGAPALVRWNQNNQVRALAESLQNGLMIARGEAVHRNAAVRFQLVTTTDASCAPSDTGRNWVVSLDDPAGNCNVAASDAVAPRILKVGAAAESTRNAAVNGGGVSLVAFNGLGQASTAATIDITNPAAGACITSATTGAADRVRCLRVTVSAGGQVRMCDPAVTAVDDPRRC
jgi:type IV fimbrial biogenesis protein FimT